MAMVADIDKIFQVLLADGWHWVHDHSFEIDTYSYVWIQNDGSKDSVWENDKDPLGFQFEEHLTDDNGMVMFESIISGKLSSIIAVREK